MAAFTEAPPATAQPAQTQLAGSPSNKGKQAPKVLRGAAKDSVQVQQSAAASQPPSGHLQERPARAQAPCAAAEKPAHSLQRPAAGATSPAGGVKAEHRHQQSLAVGVQSATAQLKPASLTAAKGRSH